MEVTQDHYVTCARTRYVGQRRLRSLFYVYVSVCLLRPRTAASREWVVRQGGVEAEGIDGYEGRRNRHLPGLDQKETFRECQG